MPSPYKLLYNKTDFCLESTCMWMIDKPPVALFCDSSRLLIFELQAEVHRMKKMRRDQLEYWRAF